MTWDAIVIGSGFTVVFGSGTATVAVQTFAGGIVVRTPERGKTEEK